FHQDLYSTTWVFTTPLALVGRVVGVHILAGEVVIALWATLTCVATTLIALRTLARRGLALLAGLVPALLPSQILWSSVWLKDAAVSACLALVVLGVTVARPATERRMRIAGIVIVAAGLLGLSGLRLNSFVLACWALAVWALFYYWRRPAMVAT